MADPTRPEPQKINPTRPGSKIFDPDPSLPCGAWEAQSRLKTLYGNVPKPVKNFPKFVEGFLCNDRKYIDVFYILFM